MSPITPLQPTTPQDGLLLGETVPYDGYGSMLRDAYEAGPRRGAYLQIIERDDGLVSIEDAYRYFTQPDEWIAGERQAVTLATGRVLDIGCAVGRHMLAIAGAHEVVGIDPSPGAVAVARARGLDVRVGTVTEPGDVGTFDTLLMLGGNLGLLGSREHAPVVLDSLARLARPGARLLAIGHDPHGTAAPEHRTYHERNADYGRLPGQVRMRVRYKAWTSAWFDRLLLSPNELTDLLIGTGWTLHTATYSPGTAGFYLAVMTHADSTPTAPRAC
ncbi:methyltransferase domain-containing protein [Spirillospora sp. NBC_00431]